MVIDHRQVQLALNTLLTRSTKARQTSLQNCHFVKQFLAHTGLVTTPQTELYAVQEILVKTITATLDKRHKMLGLVSSVYPATYADIHQALEFVRCADSCELLVCNILYYRYVCAEFELSIPDISDLLWLSSRTVHRYHQDGVAQLTQKLIAIEVAALQQAV